MSITHKLRLGLVAAAVALSIGAIPLQSAAATNPPSTVAISCYNGDPVNYANFIGNSTGVDGSVVCATAMNKVGTAGAYLEFISTSTLGFAVTTAEPHPGTTYQGVWHQQWLEPQTINDTHGVPHTFCPKASTWPPHVTCQKHIWRA